MIERVAEFCDLLRRNRVRVSVGEVLDAAEAAAVIGLSSAADLRAALAAVLVKLPGDRPVFDELFSLFFLRGADLARLAAAPPLLEVLRAHGLTEEQIERVLALLADQASALGAVARSGLGLHGLELAPLLRLAGLRDPDLRFASPLMAGFQSYRVLDRLGVPDAEREIARIVELIRRSAGDAAADAVVAAAARNLAALRRAVRGHVQAELERQLHDQMAELRERSLETRPFGQLTEAEIADLRGEVRRLAEKLRERAAEVPRPRARGRLDARRTLRRSLRTGGTPFELVWRVRRPQRPRLVVLCDVSDSVRNVSRFMLQFVHTVQELFSTVRSFVFVSDLGEVTSLFRTHDAGRAVELAYGGAVINVRANSNYGRALDVFERRHADAVTPRTTLLVIGDARTNYLPPNAEALARLRRRARRVLWLNSEPAGAWGFGDSAMGAYAPHCDRVESAHDLRSLRKVVDALVL